MFSDIGAIVKTLENIEVKGLDLEHNEINKDDIDNDLKEMATDLQHS